MTRVKGASEHLSRIRGITDPRTGRNIGKAVYWGADQIRVEARRLVTEGSVSGKNHVPSLPGEPPKSDTLTLANGMIARQTGPISAQYASTAPYSAYLQWGTSKMAARPYADVAARNKQKAIAQKIGVVVSDAVRRKR